MAEAIDANQRGKAGYEGYISDRVVTLPEVLETAGYRTYIAGKWHLGLDEAHSPKARGFKRSFVLLNGGGGHFDELGINWEKSLYREDGKLVGLPEDFYSSRIYTDKIIHYLKADEKSEKPFFAYLAYTAPHWPIQAPREAIDRYRRRYNMGYDERQKQRLRRAAAEGVIKPDSVLSPPIAGEPLWHELSQGMRAVEERKMEVYAAMIDEMDRNLGRLLDYLEAKNELNNTIIFFMSDNGAEGHDSDFGYEKFKDWSESCCDNSLENIGNANSYVFVGPNWARASVPGKKYFKGFTSEGGISSPAFILYPNQRDKQSINHNFVSVEDVMPTLLELAGVAVKAVKGRKLQTMDGSSFIGRDKFPDHGWEIFGRPAYRYGNWKITRFLPPLGNGQWQLYNLENDTSEQNDLAREKPKLLREMVARWHKYAEDNCVVLPDNPRSL